MTNVLQMYYKCGCIIEIMYSTCEYDVLLGIVNEIKGIPTRNKSLAIGDIVFAFLDEHCFKVCDKDPFGSLYMNEECVFKMPEDQCNSALFLPVFKYGCIAQCIKNCIKNVLSQPSFPIHIFCNYNIYNIICKLIDTECFAWHDNDTNANLIKGTIIKISPGKLAFDNNININFDNNSLLEILGHDSIEKIIRTIIDKHILANICYVKINQLTEDLIANQHCKSRFFNVISFTKEII